MELSSGVLIHHPTKRDDPAVHVIALSRQALVRLVGDNTDVIRFEADLGLEDHPLAHGEPETNFPSSRPNAPNRA